MSVDLTIQCACGQFQAAVHDVCASSGNRILCYCKDCQSFAHYLERADEVLDENGGTDIFQTSPARLEILKGAEQLACMRLTPKGLTRWHTQCCKTPVANTMGTPKMPFMGVLLGMIKPENGSLDEMLGPVRGRVFSEHMKGNSAGAKKGEALMPLLRLAKLILTSGLRGDAKKSLFFNHETGLPITAPYVLSESELEALETARERSA